MCGTVITVTLEERRDGGERRRRIYQWKGRRDGDGELEKGKGQ